ncbi:hypothetical protein GCM10012275_18260 [Longimycelium tulufanense]|uniref:DUF4097 domain-containing protein n=1 Tax=Longimycelium tulufanense TaxID=907463 RepID=A0A8J3FUZ4_9PSEU|nr:DUF4097 family beta strand repeat-containing protein [Longimycelium tulufanense]GGM47510.1 hypothetical protein GCM10012275_18260 [Longimycelium tulufanense]
MRRVALLLGGLVLASFALGGCDVVEYRKLADDSTVLEWVTKVRIEGGAGGIDLRVGERTSVHRTVSYIDIRPPVLHRVENETLVLPTTCGPHCSVRYTVTVPAGTSVGGYLGAGDLTLAGAAAVDVEVGAGDVVIRDVTGPVNVELRSGNVTVERAGGNVGVRASSGHVELVDVTGQSNVELHSGDVSGRGLRGVTRVRGSSGDITLHLAEPRSVRAETMSGDVRLTVPRGPYRVVTKTFGGSETMGLQADPRAENTLEVRTASGNIVINTA